MRLTLRKTFISGNSGHVSAIAPSNIALARIDFLATHRVPVTFPVAFSLLRSGSAFATRRGRDCFRIPRVERLGCFAGSSIVAWQGLLYIFVP